MRLTALLTAIVVLSCGGRSDPNTELGLGGNSGKGGNGGNGNPIGPGGGSGGSGGVEQDSGGQGADGGSGGSGNLCNEGSYYCAGDTLMVCTHPSQGYGEAKKCEPGMCSASFGQCNSCKPSERTCANATTVSLCDTFGQQTVHGPCPEPSPYCVDKGQCVECNANTHCPPSKSECISPSCKSNVCTFQSVPNGIPCGEGGTCENGLCSKCTAGQINCDAVGIPVACSSTGIWVPQPECAPPSPHCIAGNCVECTSSSHCPAATNECMSAACGASNECGFVPIPSGSPCSNNRQCNGAGACLCTPGAQMNNGNTPRTCNESGAWTNGTPCFGSTGQCHNGKCVQCAESFHCP
ncbi:MAG: hypothetical protein FWD57_12510, partial [Polyangiaceae bacterium]|nr:hypothetical protein [Polyangiaceae bacterium]